MTPLGPLMIDVDGFELTPEDQQLMQHPLVGGVILFTRNFRDKAQLVSLVHAIRRERKNIIIAVDYEGGRVQRFREEFTRIPPMRALGRCYDSAPDDALAMAESMGLMIAAELGEIDIDMALTPVVDLEYGCCEVIGNRAFHGKPEAVARLAGALRQGLAQAGMAATAKHFPGHGAVVEDSHEALPVDNRSWEELADDIAPYRSLVAEGLESIMMAHIRYPAVDSEVASLSSHWIATVLRQELNFQGAVFCDDLSMGGAAVVGSYTERARLALAAGCDFLPVCNNRSAVHELLENIIDPEEAPGAQARRGALARRTVAAPATDRLQAAVAHVHKLAGYV